MTASPRGPLGPNYRRLFGSAACANLGDGVMTVAVVWLASSLTRDPLLITLVGLASRLPWLLFSLPAGVLADRYDRHRLVAWMDVARCVVVGLLAIPVTLMQGRLPDPEELAAGAAPAAGAGVLLAALCVAALLIGFAEVVRDNAAQTLVPSIVPADRLERANGRLWGAESAANNFIGPPLGGVLIGLAIGLPFALNAAMLAVSAALVFAIDIPRTRAAATAASRRGWRSEIGEGLRWLWRHDVLRALALLLGAMNFLSAMTFAVMVLFVQEVLGLFEGWQFGLVLTGVATGALVGSVLSDRVTARMRHGTALLCTMVGSALGMAGIGLTSSAVLVWLLGVGTGFLIVLWNVITVSLRQRVIPDALLGRVNSVYRFFGWGTISLGTLLGGVIVTLAEPGMGREWALRLPFLAAAAGNLALLAYAVPRIGNTRLERAQADPTSADPLSTDPLSRPPASPA